MMDKTSLEAAQRRARLRWIVQAEADALIRDGLGLVRQLHGDWPAVPPDQLIALAQLGGLRNAAAWHEDRPRAHDRLASMDRELERLVKRSTDARRNFYEGLKKLIAAPQDETEPRWQRVAERLGSGISPDEVRLAMALATLDTLLAIYRSRAAQLAVQQRGGLQWP